MKYDAFISYRHLPKDMFVAKRVHKALETTKIPKKIQREIGRKKIDRVFRDQEELPIGSDLGSNIEAALREAAFLVVICSPQTKESYWVMKEIDTFISMHGRENILAVLVEGEPADSFPPQLLTDENGSPVEPLAADVRGDSPKEVKKKLKTESLRLAASILHVDYDDLKQRHRERQMRRNVGIAASVAVVAVAFGIYNAYNLSKINSEYQQKLINESKVLAATALDILEDGDTKTAALVAMEGLSTEENKRPYVADSVYALSQALGTYNLGIQLSHDLVLNHDVNVSDFALNVEGTRAVSVDNDNSMYIWNLENGNCLFKKQVDIVNENEDKIIGLGYSGDLAVVVTSNFVRGYEEDGTVSYEYQMESAATFADVDLNGKYVTITVNAYDSETFKTNNYLIVLDAATGAEYKRFINQTELGYGPTIKYDESYDRLLIEHVASDDEEQNFVTYIDLNSENIIDIPITGGAFIGGDFVSDKDIVYSSMSYDALLSGEDCNMLVTKINPLTGEVKWTRELYYGGDILSTSYSHLRVRELDFDGTNISQVLVNGIQTLYVMDLFTGEDVCSVKTNGYIENFMASKNNAMMSIGTSDGKFYYYDGITGSIYNNFTVDVADSLIDFHYSNQVLVAKGYRSPMLTVMRFKADEDYILQKEMENGIYGGAAASPSGDTYVIETSAGRMDDPVICRVFDTKTGEEIGNTHVDDARYADSVYLDDDTIMIPTYDGRLFFYSIKDNDTEILPAPEEAISFGYAISNNKNYVAFTYDSNYYIYSTKDRKLINSGTSDMRFWSLSISNNGKTIYGVNVQNEAYRIDAAAETTERIYEEKLVNAVVTSNEEDIIAVVTKDGHLYVENTTTGETENELEFYGDSNDFVKFSEDNNLLYLQGNDLYFKIYDRIQSKTVFLMDGQMNDLVNSCYDEASNTLSIYNDYDMFIIDLNTFGLLDHAEYGRLYIPQYQTIVSVYGTNLVEFKFKTQKDLVGKVEERFENAKLTELQKLKYLVE